ncbi:hypothetical protein GX50_02309 [[Emmonsia] crescens]|uniref:Uncharacterized protein n=1 Tax=[Emmonsia] crescens TaxID=73230 RepID=A0A2B7ZNU8_9EURO|nr:hypothetical protein GX50_02309 [Emmonsia crescens]
MSLGFSALDFMAVSRSIAEMATNRPRTDNDVRANEHPKSNRQEQPVGISYFPLAVSGAEEHGFLLCWWTAIRYRFYQIGSCLPYFETEKKERQGEKGSSRGRLMKIKEMWFN